MFIMKRDNCLRRVSPSCLGLVTNLQVGCICFVILFISASLILGHKRAFVNPGRSLAGWSVEGDDWKIEQAGRASWASVAATEPSFTNINIAFRKWDTQVGCPLFREKITPLVVNRSLFLQDANPVRCEDLTKKHVSVLVKEYTWIPDSLNNLYACGCGLTCLWGKSDVLADDPDAHLYEMYKPPQKRRAGDPLRVYLDLEPQMVSASQDIFVSYHHKDDLQVTYAGASFHINRNYYISPQKNPDILVYWSSSRCVKARQDIARSFLPLVSHHSFGSCLNNVGGRDTLDKMYPRCRYNGGGNGWSTELHCGMSHYKFVLAIENTFRDSYVTEKLFYALDAGSVPIYFGAPNVLELVPPHSIIEGAKFSSMEELALYVKHLADNPVQYAEYHAWRRCGELGNYRHTRAVSLDSLPCRLCAVVSRMGGRSASATL